MNPAPDALVYILGTGSKWENNEIRYSLRSAEKFFSHGPVFLIGECPEWIRNVQHIPAEDPYSVKVRNGIHKITVAAREHSVPERFVLMNDDFFFLRPVQSIEPFYRRTLIDAKREHPTRTGAYFMAMRKTYERLQELGIKDPLDYSLHIPIVYEKAKILEVVEKMGEPAEGYLFRTAYGNIHKIGGSLRKDVKIRYYEQLYRGWMENSDMFSTTDELIESPKFKKKMLTLFPDPSQYEGDGGEAL